MFSIRLQSNTIRLDNDWTGNKNERRGLLH